MAKRKMTQKTFIILAQEAIEGLKLNDSKETYKSLRNNTNKIWTSFDEIQKALSNKVELNEKIEDLEEEIDDNPDDESLKNELDQLLSSKSTINLISDLENGFNQKPQSFAKISGFTVKMKKYKDKNVKYDDIATYQSVVYGNNQIVLAKDSKIQKAKKSKSKSKSKLISKKKKKNKNKTKKTGITNNDFNDYDPIKVHTFKVQKIWNDLYIPEDSASNAKKKSFVRSRGESDCFILKNTKKKTQKKSKKGHGRSRRTQSVISSKKYRNTVDKYKANNTKKCLQSDILSEICQSLQFGAVSVDRVKKKNSKSDKLSFWFNISFHTNHREKYLLYFYYSREEYIKQKSSNFMPIKTKKSRISCDSECAQINGIINDENDDIALPKNVLIEVFKYIKPRRMIELYAYNMCDDDNPFGNKHFVGSNVEWICNNFGIETVFIHKFLVKMLYFIYSPAIDQYIETM